MNSALLTKLVSVPLGLTSPKRLQQLERRRDLITKWLAKFPEATEFRQTVQANLVRIRQAIAARVKAGQ